MKKIALIILSLLYAVNVSSQEAENECLKIQSVMDVCIAMRDAVAVGDTTAIRQSSLALESVGVRAFNDIECLDDSIGSLNGHLVFDEAFADSLAEGKLHVYDNADEMEKSIRTRGYTTDGRVFTKTCFVKAGKSTKWVFNSKGYQELAVIAEANGRVTMKIHVTNSNGLDKRYDDRKLVKIGMNKRQRTFHLPENMKNKVELEVVNCGSEDCSFVIISN